MFLSDDKDSKCLQRIINKKCLGAVKVFNRKEFFGAYVDNGGKNIPRSDRRQISHEKICKYLLGLKWILLINHLESC